MSSGYLPGHALPPLQGRRLCHRRPRRDRVGPVTGGGVRSMRDRSRLWVRPLDVFAENVPTPQGTQPRFAPDWPGVAGLPGLPAARDGAARCWAATTRLTGTTMIAGMCWRCLKPQQARGGEH
ncbi:DUF1653 domain-containing protein [Cupriavidus basilensis]